MTAPSISDVGVLALRFAATVTEVARCKCALELGYENWRKRTGCMAFIEMNSPEGAAMKAATASEYKALQAAKAKERSAKAKLVSAANQVQTRIEFAMLGGS